MTKSFLKYLLVAHCTENLLSQVFNVRLKLFLIVITSVVDPCSNHCCCHSVNLAFLLLNWALAVSWISYPEHIWQILSWNFSCICSQLHCAFCVEFFLSYQQTCHFSLMSPSPQSTQSTTVAFCSGVHSFMKVKLAQGGGCTSKVAVYAPAEWADTLTLFHL